MHAILLSFTARAAGLMRALPLFYLPISRAFIPGVGVGVCIEGRIIKIKGKGRGREIGDNKSWQPCTFSPSALEGINETQNTASGQKRRKKLLFAAGFRDI